MPELPEVETVRRSLLPHLIGRRIEDVKVHETRLRRPVAPRQLRARTRGRRIAKLERRAKYLLIRLDGEPGSDNLIVVHLGMSGRLTYVPRETPRETHTHIVFRLDDDNELRFRDHRRFGLVEAMTLKEFEKDPRFAALGVEPLSPRCNAAYFRTRAAGSRRPIKNFIMDAHQVVGVGNIYASEALHVAGIHPERAAGRLSKARWTLLAKAIKDVLRRAIREGGTTLNDFQNGLGDAGYFQVSLRVYGREGEPCEGCARPLKRKVLAGRSTFYCTRCQR